jgi:hypothetical protein
MENAQTRGAGRGRRTPFLLILLTALCATAVASAAGTKLGLLKSTKQSAQHAASLARISTKASGPAVSLLPIDQRVLAQFAHGGADLTTASTLGTRGGRLFYVIANSAGSDCYAVGPAAAVRYTLGQVACNAAFPSASAPLVDFTVVHGGLGKGSPGHVFRSEGIAADGIAAVGFESADGSLVGVQPVVGNLYASTAPPAEAVHKLVALDSDSKVVWSEEIAE